MIRSSAIRLTASLAIAGLIAACGGGAAPATPTAAAPTTLPATPAPTTVPATAGPTPGPVATNVSTGEPSVAGPANVQPGVSFEVAWTGPNGDRDYVTIVAAGAAKWTNEPYFYTGSNASPGKLIAPPTPGSYELWYVQGVDSKVLARSPITVSTFVGTIDGPDSVQAGTQFEVTWTGPDGPRDYITIVKAGATQWTNESYFYTTDGPKGTLQAPIDAGAYELWYVSGAKDTIQLRVPITVTPFSASVDGPGVVNHGAPVSVAWTGPAGAGDYVTIAPAGSPEGSYLAYCYTTTPSPCVMNAPDKAGDYEVRYVTGKGKTLASEPLKVK